MRKVWFTVVKGSNEGRVLELEPGVTILGRLDQPTPNDPVGSRRWTIYDPTVSRTHCGITWTEGESPMLTHLSTTNDTLVNGERVTKHVLSPKELVQVGLTHMLFQMEVIDESYIESISELDTVAEEPTPEPAPEAEEEPVEEVVEVAAESGWGDSESSDWAPEPADQGHWRPTESLEDDKDTWKPR